MLILMTGKNNLLYLLGRDLLLCHLSCFLLKTSPYCTRQWYVKMLMFFSELSILSQIVVCKNINVFLIIINIKIYNLMINVNCQILNNQCSLLGLLLCHAMARCKQFETKIIKTLQAILRRHNVEMESSKFVAKIWKNNCTYNC